MSKRSFAKESDPTIRQYGALVIWRVHRRWAWSLGYPNISEDDLEQQGMIGLLRAKELFDATKGVKFQTFAVIWIDKYIQDFIRANWCPGFATPDYLNRHFDNRSSESVRFKMESASRTCHISAFKSKLGYPATNILAADNPVGSSFEARDTLLDIISKMRKELCSVYPRKRAELLLNIFLRSKKGETLKEIGSDYQLTKQRISQLNEVVNQTFKRLNQKHQWAA